MEKIKMKFTKDRIGLTFILILSSILNFANLSVEGYSNEYYAAGVKSMLKSFKNFFFVAFDPTGFVTIDKPPLGFWMQAISAKIFGYHGWSILLPQAAAGVISVAILFSLVKRYFGSKAGLISALCLAVTPIFVADSRNNTIDNQLVMVLLIAAYFLFKAIESGKIKHIILSLVFVGIGFNIKMLQAYLVVPAIYFTYFIASKIKLKKKIINLAISTVVLVAVSLSWAIIVDLVPASYRPYVGSSTNNSELELILGHNGVERLTSSSGSGGGMGSRPSGKGNMEMPQGNGGQNMPGGFGNDNTQQDDKNSNISNDNTSQSTGATNMSQKTATSNSGNMGQGGGPGNGGPGNMPQGGNNGNGGPGNMQGGPNGKSGGMQSSFGGSYDSGITRLFTSSGLADQISWLIPLALFGFIAAAMKEKLFRRFDNGRKLCLVFWITYLVPQFIYFSFTKGLFHPYYLTMLSAPIAALVGIGMKYMWEYYKENSWKSFFLPVALIVDAAIEILILSNFYKTSNVTKFLSIVVGILCIVSAFVLMVNKIINICNGNKQENPKIIKAFVAIGLVGLLITPTFWSGTTLFYKMSGTFPSAGVSLVTGGGDNGGKMMGSDSNQNSKLISYLEANKTTEKYLLVTLSASGEASQIIINTNESVMALGGFLSSDKIITLSEFKQLVKKGEVRYVMVQGGMGGMQGQNSESTTANNSSSSSSNTPKSPDSSSGNSNQEIMNWVKEHGTLVDSSEWSDSSSSNTENNLTKSSDNITTSKSSTDNSNNNNSNQFGGGMQHQGGGGMGGSGQLYDLKGSLD